LVLLLVVLLLVLRVLPMSKKHLVLEEDWYAVLLVLLVRVLLVLKQHLVLHENWGGAADKISGHEHDASR